MPSLFFAPPSDTWWEHKQDLLLTFHHDNCLTIFLLLQKIGKTKIFRSYHTQNNINGPSLSLPLLHSNHILLQEKHHSLLPPSKSHDNPSNSSLLSTHHVQVLPSPRKKTPSPTNVSHFPTNGWMSNTRPTTFVLMGTLLGTIVIVLVAWTEFCYKFGVR